MIIAIIESTIPIEASIADKVTDALKTRFQFELVDIKSQWVEVSESVVSDSIDNYLLILNPKLDVASKSDFTGVLKPRIDDMLDTVLTSLTNGLANISILWTV